ncbi:hypothetical protein K7H09_19230 [Halomonas sp. IOP_14]|uniref:hypothetical protein n=1 Tax=unclassified Halomonas TaxID=2609666 RepID=UPI00038DBB7C|nr:MULTISPECIES: hypothetical protein [unclassified Halomonas]MCD1588138.1 hypothetical protein [Halomonas sp. IOP_14]CDG54561.1 putative integral membrane protein [Halomonas sp. A3H3]
MLINLLTFTVGLLGVGLVAFGAWLVLPAAGYIVAGSFCLFWSWLASKAAAQANQPPSVTKNEEDS